MYEHDCDECIYLGSGVHMNECVEWYAHIYVERGVTDTTIIARYGDEGSEYFSYAWSHFTSLIDHGREQISSKDGVNELDF